MFDMPDYDGHEAVHWFHDAATGYRGLVAIHDSTLGPACGGTRMWAYVSAGAALTDALRLSRGNVSQAAKLLGINRTTLYGRLGPDFK